MADLTETSTTISTDPVTTIHPDFNTSGESPSISPNIKTAVLILDLVPVTPLGVLIIAGTVVVFAIIFISIVALVLFNICSSRRRGTLNIRKRRKELASKPLPSTPKFSEHTYDSPQTPEGPARVIQAVSWSSLRKGSQISRNGYVCRWMGTLADDKGSLSAVVISTINERIKRERLRWNDCYMQSIGLPQHQNLLNVIGYVFYKDQLHVVHGYQSSGNLQGFLQEMYGQDCSDDSPLKTIPSTFTSFAAGIVDGMEFLSSNGFTHPGLSARKVLLSCAGVCKLYDLCLADVAAAKACRYVLNSSVRYLPPETVFQTTYTQASDVWGLGIVLWQIFSFGKDPFEELEVREFKLVLKRKLRLPEPNKCPDGLFSLMCDMWAQSPSDRLTVSEVREKLREVLVPPTTTIDDNNGSDYTAVDTKYDMTIADKEELPFYGECENEVKRSEDPDNRNIIEEVDSTAADDCSQTAIDITSELASNISELESLSCDLYSEVVVCPSNVTFEVKEIYMTTSV